MRQIAGPPEQRSQALRQRRLSGIAAAAVMVEPNCEQLLLLLKRQFGGELRLVYCLSA